MISLVRGGTEEREYGRAVGVGPPPITLSQKSRGGGMMGRFGCACHVFCHGETEMAPLMTTNSTGLALWSLVMDFVDRQLKAFVLAS
jgi:hypothetical protein